MNEAENVTMLSIKLSKSLSFILLDKWSREKVKTYADVVRVFIREYMTTNATRTRVYSISPNVRHQNGIILEMPWTQKVIARVLTEVEETIPKRVRFRMWGYRRKWKQINVRNDM